MQHKRILTVQDISCVGKCSMTIALPVLAACGHETCILPTAVLSTHTGGFSKPQVVHLGGALEGFWRHWQREGIRFDGIYTGYIGSVEALDTILELSRILLKPEGLLIVDPAMADHGKLYSGLDQAYADKMALLCRSADILLPNITEAAMLSGLPLRETLDPEYVGDLLERMGCPRVVLTGVGYDPQSTGVEVYDRGVRRHYRHRRIPASFHGTGDLFAATFVGVLLQGRTIQDAAAIAADRTLGAIDATWQAPGSDYGIRFEEILPQIGGLS